MSEEVEKKFFTLNEEKKIGYKKLTEADLGLSDRSHQTHIGLYEKKGMLSFLKDEDSTNAMLIYNSYCEILPCDFDRIENPDGSFRSPKIKIGETENSLVKQIRHFAKENKDKSYFLLWFGLDNKELLFWLFDDKSEEYKKVNEYLPKVDTVYDVDSIRFSVLLDFIESKIDNITLKMQEDLEIVSQTSDNTKKYKSVDIEKAQKRFQRTGRLGEELINEYLEKLKLNNEISSFVWENKSRESGKPFDFVIEDKKYIDVKTTSFKFEQPIFFSNGEISFIKSISEDNYSVYRVFDLKMKIKKFRKCQKCFNYMNDLNSKIEKFQNELNKVSANMRNLKISLQPDTIAFKDISSDIIL